MDETDELVEPSTTTTTTSWPVVGVMDGSARLVTLPELFAAVPVPVAIAISVVSHAKPVTGTRTGHREVDAGDVRARRAVESSCEDATFSHIRGIDKGNGGNRVPYFAIQREDRKDRNVVIEGPGPRI